VLDAEVVTVNTTMVAAGLLPASHLDLLDRPLPTVLTTELPDGRLQSTVVWCDREGEHVLVNTMREFQKARNMSARPRATVLVLEPGNDSRWIEVRAAAHADPRDPVAHLDALARRYTGLAPFFGAVIPASLAAVEHPMVFRLEPVAVCPGPLWVHGRRTVSASGPGSTRPRYHCDAEPRIPASHRDLLDRPVAVALSTRLPSGAAQTQPVWCSLDGNDVLVNTTRQRRKGRNLAADPRATVLAVDRDDSGRWIEIRGDVDLIEDGALAHLDMLTERYTGQRHYYGTVYPSRQRWCETRVIVRIHPRRVTCDAIHSASA
jgi:PPOX class probable F420-dependent enzyme